VSHVEEVVDPCVLTLTVLAEVSLTLRQLVVMMGERKINTTGVNIHDRSQNATCHHGAPFISLAHAPRFNG
jgi:hypothetical protein